MEGLALWLNSEVKFWWGLGKFFKTDWCFFVELLFVCRVRYICCYKNLFYELNDNNHEYIVLNRN